MTVNDKRETESAEVSSDPGPDDDLPPGSHALEVAARRGFGPLSPAAKKTWHGNAVPCVTCGQLVERGALQCDHCSQDLRTEMVERMRAHAGPWFVLEHLRPFPGVSLDRIIRQIRRGLITETSIVRGPATDYHWRFAVETPGLCLYFGKCWHCHHAVTAAETYCPACLSRLSLDPARPAIPTTAPKATSPAPSLRDSAPPLSPNVAPPRRGDQDGSVVPGSSPSATSRAVGGAPQSTGRKPGDTAPALLSATPTDSTELNDLASAIRSLETLPEPADWHSSTPTTPNRAGWIIAAALILAVVALLTIVKFRAHAIAPQSPAPTTTSQR